MKKKKSHKNVKFVTTFDKPDYSGYLKKKGGTIKFWRKRWFELRGSQLIYFPPSNHKKPRGAILIGTDTIFEIDKKNPKNFRLKGLNFPRTFELQGQNAMGVKEWEKEIKRCVKNSKVQNATFTNKTDGKVNMLFSMDPNVTLLSPSDFKVIETISRGVNGKVVKVERKFHGLHRKVFAMKIFKNVDDNWIKQNRVVKILKKLDHPYIVKLYYAFRHSGKMYFVMEYCPGGELFFQLSEMERFEEKRAMFYAAEIFLVISYLHQNDIIYRDLKPENCVLNEDGHVKLTDFGLSKARVVKQTYTFCGTPEYLAPELLKGKGYGKSVDWWSLGTFLYEMIEGNPPYFSKNKDEMYKNILTKDLEFSENFSEDAVDLIKGLNRKDPKKRYSEKQIKDHPFFKEIDWDKLFIGAIKPPFTPKVDVNSLSYKRYRSSVRV